MKPNRFRMVLCLLLPATVLFCGCGKEDGETPDGAIPRLTQKMIGTLQQEDQPAQAEASPPLPTPAAEVSVSAADITNGLSEAEVINILGKPNGRMVVSNGLYLIYNRESIELRDGQTVNVDQHLVHRLTEKKSPATRTADRSKKTTPKTAFLDKLKARAKEVVLKNKNGVPINHSSLTVPGKVTVVDFYATWCGPCRHLAPILDSMTKNDPDVVLRKVDIGNWGSAVTKRYNISSVPNVRVFDSSGRLVALPTSNPNQIKKYIEQAKRQ